MFHPQPNGRLLTPQEAARVYDRIGRFQDWQAIYEGRAIRELIRCGTFNAAKSVFEFGCGTGAFAARLFRSHLASDCRYVGVDVSPRMIRLSSSRLGPWAGRVQLELTDGSPRIEQPDGTFDHFVSNYVFDLLGTDYAAVVLLEAHRLLTGGGKLCLVSLGHGASGLPALVTALWQTVWRLSPQLVGGCRPVDLRSLLPREQWFIEQQRTMVSCGIASEVVIASRA